MKRIVLGIAISGIALYLAFHNIDFSRLWLNLKSTKWSYAVLSAAVLISCAWLQAWRWQIILEHSKKIPMKWLVRGEFIGYFGNNVLPLRMGELLRSYFLARQEGIAISEVLGSVVNERFLDILVIIIFVGILSISGLLLPDNVITAFWSYVGITTVLLISIILYYQLKEFPFLSRKLSPLLDSFLGGFRSLRSARNLLKLFLLTLLIWAFYAIGVVLILKAVGIHSQVMLVILILVLTALGLSLPCAPGAIGTYHMAVIIALNGIAGVDATLSRGVAVLMHATSYIPFTLIGMWFFFKSSVKLSDIKATVGSSEPVHR